jgi:hypothetical protein
MLETLVDARPETLTEPIHAWRTWLLEGSPDGCHVRLLPLFGDGRPWPVLEPARATCAWHRRHLVPDPDCTCGLYAVNRSDDLRRSRAPAVLGSVALWGRVVEHAYGYRAELAYPQRLRLACFLCFSRRGMTGMRQCEVAVRRRGGRLVPLCADDLELCRRYGYPLRHLLPGRVVEQALLSSYVVDTLRVV